MALRNGSKLIKAITDSTKRVVSTTSNSQQSANIITIDELAQETVSYNSNRL